MPARSVCLVTLSLSEAGPGRFGRQVSVTDIYHTIPYQSRVAGESRKSCELGCGRALLWNALPVARRALGARWMAELSACASSAQSEPEVEYRKSSSISEKFRLYTLCSHFWWHILFCHL